MDEYDTKINCPYCGKELIIELYGSATKVFYGHLRECNENKDDRCKQHRKN